MIKIEVEIKVELDFETRVKRQIRHLKGFAGHDFPQVVFTLHSLKTNNNVDMIPF